MAEWQSQSHFRWGGRLIAVATAFAVTAGLIVLAPPQLTAIGATTSPSQARTAIHAVDLNVNGRYDSPRGIGDRRPALGWRLTAPHDPKSPCFDPKATGTCPLDRQTAYQVEAAPTARDLQAGRLMWDTGKVSSAAQNNIAFGKALQSRDTVAWRVRVWDADGRVSEWSQPETFTVGLLHPQDWGDARWIEKAGRVESDPMPIFARQLTVDPRRKLASATLYLSGIGLHHATVNGKTITNELLAPGNSNYQLSSEYRTYDITHRLSRGPNGLGVQLGNGTAYVRRSVTNSAVGRNAPYSWWQSQLKGNGTVLTAASPGATHVQVSSVSGYHVGGTVNVDTGDGGERLESRRITAIGTAGADGTGIEFTPPLDRAHAVGSLVTGSGNNVAASDASAGAAVTPRFIGRLELRYQNGSSESIVTDRSWRAASGPLVTDAWYSGSDYDARREQVGWNMPNADLTASAKRRDGSAMDWAQAGIAAPPNLATTLVARTAPPVIEKERFAPVGRTNPAPGTWVFNFGQNIVGWPEINVAEMPQGTTIKLRPAESLAADGTVNQASLMGGGASRGTDLFNTYTSSGAKGVARYHPLFNYFGMQWVQVTGLPEGYTPTKHFLTGVRLQADTPVAGRFSSSNDRINRIHRAIEYSFAGNIMSVFTDCPGREKLSYPADYTMPMGGIHRNFELKAFMQTTMHHLVEGQSVAETPMKGNVALKTPVYDWGYTGRFGDEINWGNAIVLVPSFLYELYGDTQTMTKYYDNMTGFIDYIQREKVGTGDDAHIVDAALADWSSAEQTSGRITGTWGYYLMITKMAQMAELTGHDADAEKYRTLADDIKQAFNDAFLNESLGYYTAEGNEGEEGATQSAQALALDAGLVPDEYRDSVLQALVDGIYAFHPNGTGPHFSGGTIGMAPTVRALYEGDRADVLWDVLQEDDYPGYGFFLESTTANPGGMTTIGERWTRGDSKNHMILAQIEEWFQSGLAGIREADGSSSYKKLVIKPQPVGDLTSAAGEHVTPQGKVASRWTLKRGRLVLDVSIPANTSAQVWVPTSDVDRVTASKRATFQRAEAGYAVFAVTSGDFTFTSPVAS